MTGPAIAVTTKSPGTKPATAGQGPLFLVLGLAFVLACRVVLYVWMPDRTSDFDLLYDMAGRLLRGDEIYPAGTPSFIYPFPAVLLGVPFRAIPLWLARPVFDVLVGWAFVYALWKYRGPYALLALVSGAYLFALERGQTTPLMVAATLVPALGFLCAVKPNTSAALWISRPSWMPILGVSVFLALSLAVQPTWPFEWWMAVPADTAHFAPIVMRPLGALLLLAALRWYTPTGRLLLAIACLPQTTLPYELVALALIPANSVQMAVYVAGSWIAVAAATGQLPFGHGLADWSTIGWGVTIIAVYLPMLALVLRQRGRKTVLWIGKDRRRPRRLPDVELKIDASLDDNGGVVVMVTHIPTQLSATESAPTRAPALRKAQNRLAAMVAEQADRLEQNVA
ncbi:MAG TPA: hypothetical protein VGN76_09320 [Gemmatimonadales bacterium]|nr:hypothetical protein [Gemmatimonadales bacterium]